MWSKLSLRYFVGISFVMPFAEGMFDLVAILLVSTHGGTPFDLGILQVLTLLPALLLSPLAGSFMDRGGSVRIALIGNAGRLAVCVALLLLSASGRWSYGAFYAVVALYYLFWYTSVASFDALLKTLLAREHNLQGVSITQGIFQAGLLTSALATGVLAARAGLSWTIAAIALLLAICLTGLVKLAAVVRAEAAPVAVSTGASHLAELRAGFAYLLRHREVLALGVVGACVPPFFQAVNVLIAPFTFGVLHGSAITLGAIDSAAGIGSFAAAGLCLLAPRDDRRRYLYLIGAVVLLALCVLLFAATRSALSAFVCYAAVGVWIGTVKILSKSLLYDTVDERYVGRVVGTLATLSLVLGIVVSLAVGIVANRDLALAYRGLAGALVLPLAFALLAFRHRTTSAPEPDPVPVTSG
jgi:DHA3 family macrolide efflux protein-like MFS transporter